MPDRDALSGRVAVVTGGLSGIGLACAKGLQASGAQVCVGARRAGDEAKLSEFHDELGEDAYAAPLDVTDQSSVERFLSDVTDRFGPVDILVNAAGIAVHLEVVGHSDAGWRDTLDTNLTGPFRMIRATLPAMIERRWGRIVNIASTAARVGAPRYAAYCASKAGLLGLTRCVALEGAPHGVTCVAVSPTWVETEMLRNTAEEKARETGRHTEEVVNEIRRSNPQNRLVQPEELAALIVLLCGKKAAALTMEDIQVNAGAFW